MSDDLDLYIIESVLGPMPLYFNEQVGKDYGAFGGWISDKQKATEYEKEAAEILLEGPLWGVSTTARLVKKC